jgi:hypothetical protein
MGVVMNKPKHEEMVETLINGNISIFDEWVKRTTKLNLLYALEYADSFGEGARVARSIRRVYEK